jgi:hypothetical protein
MMTLISPHPEAKVHTSAADYADNADQQHSDLFHPR